MVQIVLTEEQEKVARSCPDELLVVDSRGAVVGSLRRSVIPDDDPYFTREEIEDALKRMGSNEPTYTTAEVLAHLRELEAQGR